MKKFHNTCPTALILSVILMLCGCGYQLGPGAETIDKSIRTVFIDHFQNNTSEPHLETYFRRAFSDRLIRTSAFKLAQRRDTADAVIKGKIKTFAVSPIAYQSNNLAAIERIVITMEIVFEDQKTQKIIWQNLGFAGSADYALSAANLMFTENARKNALVKLADDTAERAFVMIFSGF